MLDSSEDDRLHEFVVNLDMFSIVSQRHEADGISFVSLASFEEENEGLESGDVEFKLIVGLQHSLKRLADVNGVLLLNTNRNHKVDDLGRDLGAVFIILRFDHMLNNLFEMLLLGL